MAMPRTIKDTQPGMQLKGLEGKMGEDADPKTRPSLWNRARWRLSLAISRVAWWVMPEPQRSRCRKDFAKALVEIMMRESP